MTCEGWGKTIFFFQNGLGATLNICLSISSSNFFKLGLFFNSLEKNIWKKIDSQETKTFQVFYKNIYFLYDCILTILVG